MNKISFAAEILSKPLFQFVRQNPGRLIKILDVGTGAADVPLRLWSLARKERLHIQIDGCDKSETAVAFAQSRAEVMNSPCRFLKVDIKTDDLPTDYDVIINSLFMHHLNNAEMISFLSKAATAAKGLLIVSDLERSYLNLAMIQIATRIASTSYVVRFDGPASVRAALTVSELRSIACTAGLDTAVIAKRFPCRLLLTWQKECV